MWLELAAITLLLAFGFCALAFAVPFEFFLFDQSVMAITAAEVTARHTSRHMA